MSTKYDNIPEELRALPQWVCFKKVPRENGRVGKPPYDPRTGYGAKANDPNTWTDFDTAVRAELRKRYDGIGFEFAVDGGYVGVDLDHCLENGEIIRPEAKEIYERINSYTEVSPGGDGLHIICRGRLIPSGQNKNEALGLEIYQDHRFLTMTGNVYQGRTKINDCLSDVLSMHRKYFGQQGVQERASASPAASPVPVTLSDDEIIKKASEAANGVLFRQLWSGDWAGAGYPSQSEADMAFVKLLVYWTNGDAQRVDSLYRQSGLMRDKWDRRQSGSTYGALTIDRALREFTPYTGPDRKTAAEAFADPAAAISGAVATVADRMPRKDNPHPDSALDYLKGQFEKDILKFMSYKDRKTGFPNLDKECVGLYPGLYVIGAISSLGKTTFCCQMMDQLAAAGEKSIYFSLEQSSAEMISKSVARITAQNDLLDPITGLNRSLSSITKAVSAINIRRGHITDEVKAAVRDYAKIAGNIDLVDCGFGTTVEYVKQYVEKYIEATGEKPVVFVDYLQDCRPRTRSSASRNVWTALLQPLRCCRKKTILLLL